MHKSPILGLVLLFLACGAIAQQDPRLDGHSSFAPVAYVYVSSASAVGGPSVVYGYSAASNGYLKPISGSPFEQSESLMTANGNVLIGVNGVNFDTLQIGTDGSLSYLSSITCNQDPQYPCAAIDSVLFDMTGADFYVSVFTQDTDHITESYSVDSTTGVLSYLGDVATGHPGDFNEISFTGNNVFAYSAGSEGCLYPGLFGYQRQNDGLLGFANFELNYPKPPLGFNNYYPGIAVSDSANHVAIVEQPSDAPNCAPGPLQIATYYADPNGNLHTDSTYQNMPATAIVNTTDMKISPSRKLLALAGKEGLQLFHFNGSAPITPYTGIIVQDPIMKIFWDNNDHLYCLSSNGKLYVATVTPSEVKRALGSPYAISNPEGLFVQTLRSRAR